MSGYLLNEIRKGFYLDSVALMRLSREIASQPGVREAALMMGTPSNQAIMRSAGLLGGAIAAQGNDLIVAIKAESEDVARAAFAERRCQHRSACVVRTQWDRRSLERDGIPERLGAGRGVRRTGPLVVPDRRVSQLRERFGLGGDRLRTAAARHARRRQPSRLLLATDSRSRR